MPQGCNFDDLCRLLASGTNVVTTRGEFNNPQCLDPAVRERVEDACRRGNSSIHGTGISPGFITEALPLVLTLIQRRLDSLRIHEFADVSSRDSPQMLFQIMGFGQPPMPQADEARAQYLGQSFGPSLQLVAQALGLPLDAIEAKGEVATARNDVHIAAGVIKAGTVAAQRTTISGMRKGKALMSFSANWYCSTEIDADWDLRATGLARGGRRRHAAGHRHPLSRAGRALGRGVSQPDCAPPGQRDSLCLCCRAGDSYHRRPTPDHRGPERTRDGRLSPTRAATPRHVRFGSK